MYPASGLAPPRTRSGLAARLLSLVAALVLLCGALMVFSVEKPEHPYLVEGGVPVAGCATRFGMAPRPGDPGYRHYLAQECHTVVPDQKVPQRVGIGLATIAVVLALMVGASRQASSVPAPA
ncbi:MAG TPA: hypothetical protein VID47_19595 [Actinomycetota bacterium]